MSPTARPETSKRLVGRRSMRWLRSKAQPIVEVRDEITAKSSTYLDPTVLQRPFLKAKKVSQEYIDFGTTAAGDYLDQTSTALEDIAQGLDEWITRLDGQVSGVVPLGDAVVYPYLLPIAPCRREAMGTSTKAVKKDKKLKGKVNEPELPVEDVYSKVHQYANARLDPYLLPFQAYPETWRLLSLAAQYSERVYEVPVGAEREAHVDANWRHGTKAMVLKSIPIDNRNTIVFAIRGSQSFVDWAVNFRPAPSSPEGFLDDPGNLCHAGFLSVAKSMVKPVAARLRQLLEQDPSRTNCSLLITGHSAGGAVASLLYMHMLSETVDSELRILTDVFRRVHCVTFGTPPVLLLPLQKPNRKRYQSWAFFSVINQGDPVVRASKEYVSSLVRLYFSPIPSATSTKGIKGVITAVKSSSNLRERAAGPALLSPPSMPTWMVPPATLSNAGRLILLRQRYDAASQEDQEACCITDEQLRNVIFGDPAMHSMSIYTKRVEHLAKLAVTGRLPG